MKRMLLTMALLLGVVTMANSEDTHGQLMKLGDELASAEQRGDIAFLGRTLADDFLLIGPRGFMLNKEQYLVRYKSGALQPGTNERDELQLRLYGDAAIMTARETVTGSYQGQEFHNQLRGTRVFVKRNGHWLLAHTQLSPIMEVPPAAAK
jgi:ketosteroid isomerase-like protein